MSETRVESVAWQSLLADKLFMGQSFKQYLRGLVTPFNIVVAIILCVGIPIAIALIPVIELLIRHALGIT